MKKPALCHPEKPMLAKGLCGACYAREWAQANPERMKARRAQRRAHGPRADCHPDQPVLAQGLCQTCYRRQWRQDPENAERERATQRASWHKTYPARRRRIMLSRYGLTEADWDALVLGQEGRCGACGDATPDLQIDHCHKRGDVRALLCGSCNSAAGMAGDDPARLRAIADYLERHSAG